MPQYLVSVINDANTRTRPAEVMAPIFEAVGALNEEAMADGTFVFAGGLHELNTATVIDPRSGEPVVSDGPFLETKEYLGGFWVIEVADFDAALAWSKRAAHACQDPVELRAFMEGPPEID